MHTRISHISKKFFANKQFLLRTKQVFVLIIVILVTPPFHSVFAIDNAFSSGGTNYVIYDDQAVAGSEAGWVISANPSYTIISNQLRELCVSGQKKIALVLYFTSSGLGKEDRTYGVNSAGGTLPSWTKSTITQVLERIVSQKDESGNTCFNELQFRFRPLGRVYTDPKEWDQWNEEGYLDNKTFIFSTRDVVRTIIGNAPLSVYFDLGVEQGGEDVKQNIPYITRLWKDYTDAFGAGDTYGFSIAWDPGKLTRLVSVYDSVGIRPSQYAVDIYEAGNLPAHMDILQQLKDIHTEMQQTGEQNKPILIQETYYNDQGAYSKILEALRQRIHIRAVMQWQVNRQQRSVVGSSYIYFPQKKVGDLNTDNKVDIFDYNLLVGNFGKIGSNIIGDIDNNGKVDIFDYNQLVGNFGK